MTGGSFRISGLKCESPGITNNIENHEEKVFNISISQKEYKL